MTAVRVERWDHFGCIASTIQDWGLIDRIDARLAPDAPETLTPGDAVAGMIRNGLGFAHNPVTLTPPFFAHTPLDLLFRQGVQAEMCNRCTRGRTLEALHTYGCDVRCSALALAVCTQAGLDQRFPPLDPTSFSLNGDSGPESDTQAMHLTHGSSKEHRPDLQQAVWALMVSPDGGVPLARKCWDGNASESQMFQERAEALWTTLASSEAPRSLVADATLSSEDRAVHLATLGFLTRSPATRTLVSQVISQALPGARWHDVDEGTRSQPMALCHYGMAHRWLVVCSQAARARAAQRVNHAQQRAGEAIKKPRLHWPAKRFETPDTAPAALAAVRKSWRSPQVDTHPLLEHTRYARKGRPSAETPLPSIAWQRPAQGRPDQAVIEAHKQHHACSVMGTNIEASPLSEGESIAAYTSQSQAAGGCRFLKAPLCFVSSLFVKNPSRSQGLLMGMTWALLVYAATQRRVRKQWAEQETTIPNQSNQPTQRPTVRWVFQLSAGIHRVQVPVQGQVQELIAGRNEVQINILRVFGEDVCRLYQISPG